MWLAFKAAIHEAHETLPELPRKQEADLVSDELRNLSKKKKDACLHLHKAAGKQSCSANLKLEYQRIYICKLSEKAHNAL